MGGFVKKCDMGKGEKEGLSNVRAFSTCFL